LASMANDMRFAAAFPTMVLEDQRSALADMQVAPIASGMASLMRGLVSAPLLGLGESIGRANDARWCTTAPPRCVLFWRHDHRHLAALHPRHLLDLGDLVEVIPDPD
jgi:hypothetical protein